MSLHDPKDLAMIASMSADSEIRQLAHRLFLRSCEYRYSYNFSWLGRPIIQYPQDMIALQEIIWQVRPDLVVETGIAHGGSLIFSASMLELLGGNGEVIGIDVDIREHNRVAIESHPMFRRITLISGSSTDEQIVNQIRTRAERKRCILVILDSNHTHEHVYRELQLYTPLVSVGSYVIVSDTVVEHMPEDSFPDRPWGKGNNPMTAVRAFLAQNDCFEVDAEIEQKLLITVSPSGYLRRVRA